MVGEDGWRLESKVETETPETKVLWNAVEDVPGRAECRISSLPGYEVACLHHMPVWSRQESDLEGSVPACRCWQKPEFEGRLLEEYGPETEHEGQVSE